MSFLGGLTGSLFNPISLMQVAMGPAGWASLAVQMIGSAIGKQVIQQLGQQLGLPQGVIDTAQGVFSAATGTAGGPSTILDAVSQLAEQFGLSPAQQGELQRSAEQDSQDLFQKLSDAFKSGEKMAEAHKSTKGKGSWLQAIADALSKVLDQKVQELDKLSRDLENNKQSVKASTDLQVAGQEFSYMMNTSSTVIKTIGEGLSGMARKQ